VHAETVEFAREVLEDVDAARRPAVLHDKVLSFDPAAVAQSLSKSLQVWIGRKGLRLRAHGKKADLADRSWRLGRGRGHRGEHAKEHGNRPCDTERDHSISSRFVEPRLIRPSPNP